MGNPMARPSQSYLTGVVHPVECLKESYRLIRDQYWLFVGITLVAMLIAHAFPLILMGPMMCGVNMCFFLKQRGEKVKFETLFKGFDHFKNSFIATLIIMGISLVVIIPLVVIFVIVFIAGIGVTAYLSREGGPGALIIIPVIFAVYMLFITIVSLLIGPLTMLDYPLVADKKLSGGDAFTLGLRAGWANLWGLIGLVLLNALLSIAGVICCYVGALLVAPISLGGVTVAYRKIFPVLASESGFTPLAVPTGQQH